MFDWYNILFTILSIVVSFILFYIANINRRKILFHVNAVLTEIQTIETKIDTCNTTQTFQTPASNALTASNIVHMLPYNTYDLFGKFHGTTHLWQI